MLGFHFQHIWFLMICSIFASILSTPHSAAQQQNQCTSDYIAEKDSEIPMVVPLNENESAIDAVERIFQCRIEFDSFPKIGADVKSAEGKSLGEMAGVLLSSESIPEYFVVAYPHATGEESRYGALPSKSLTTWDRDNITTSIPLGSVADYDALKNDVPEELQGLKFLKNYGETGVDYSMMLASTYLPGDRPIVRYVSVPTEATVKIDGKSVAATNTRLLTHKSLLPTVVIDKAGYKPCTFTEGKFDEWGRIGQPEFFCELKPTK